MLIWVLQVGPQNREVAQACACMVGQENCGNHHILERDLIGRDLSARTITVWKTLGNGQQPSYGEWGPVFILQKHNICLQLKQLGARDEVLLEKSRVEKDGYWTYNLVLTIARPTKWGSLARTHYSTSVFRPKSNL